MTANYEAAQRAVLRDRPTLLLQVGDYDPSGAAIFTQLAEDVAAFAERDGFGEVQVEGRRIALTAEQVEQYDLPTAPPNLNQHGGDVWAGETCQLEAMAPAVLNALVDGALTGIFDADVLAEQIEAEDEDRDKLRAGLESMTDDEREDE